MELCSASRTEPWEVGSATLCFPPLPWENVCLQTERKRSQNLSPARPPPTAPGPCSGVEMNFFSYLKLPGLGGKRKEHGLCFGGRCLHSCLLDGVCPFPSVSIQKASGLQKGRRKEKAPHKEAPQRVHVVYEGNESKGGGRVHTEGKCSH